MKSFKQHLNEALGSVLPKEFMDIWKGKNIVIDEETVNNAAYFSNELFSVHRNTLPTSDEFTNVCKWIVDNANWTNDDSEKFLIRMMETYLQTRSISNITKTVKVAPGEFKFINTGKHYDFFDNNLATELAAIAFFNIYSGNDLKSDDTINKCKFACRSIFEPAFKKFNVFWDSWPDYSKGFEILSKHFNK